MNGEQVLHTSTTATGHTRTLAVTVSGEPAKLRFTEKYTGDGSGWLGRFTAFHVEARLDAADPGPLVAAVRDATVAAPLPPGKARDRVAGLLAATGLLIRRSSSIPWVHLGRQATLAITPDGNPPAITFARYGEQKVHVVTGYDNLDRLTEHLTGARALSTQDRIGRFIAAFEPITTREQVLALYEALGLEFEERSERRYPLLHANRANTDCIFTLTLLVSSIDDRIAFTEFYDYGARPGDAGREYGYSAVTPYASLQPLTGYLRAHLGLDERAGLDACFRELVARGVLGDGRPIEANRDLVGELFSAAGVAYQPDHWVWVDSD
ncbi:hypothetical protein [Dactylosporangium matsuzakiense]|uniref:Uncharacterized protein n=1 Tax=Dactylosporangium matsuzakiense TaxID=53360 RepID=A0A9W6KT39_9ACTN|nr:hypothetical protein [Dactylosporangium matsuzakiense]UWZ49192.1 hypothetical protein Dmats_24030 [Dactylosporangium matsuzakiense]GLL06738.1 hypothetical protein GCM10017581_084880 [Dactylosporangium matsuzakiense]